MCLIFKTVIQLTFILLICRKELDGGPIYFIVQAEPGVGSANEKSRVRC